MLFLLLLIFFLFIFFAFVSHDKPPLADSPVDRLDCQRAHPDERPAQSGMQPRYTAWRRDSIADKPALLGAFGKLFGAALGDFAIGFFFPG